MLAKAGVSVIYVVGAFVLAVVEAAAGIEGGAAVVLDLACIIAAMSLWKGIFQKPRR